MEKELTLTYRITTNMLDQNDYIRPVSLLDMAQHIAGEHADLVGIGFEDFIKKGWIWVIVRNKLEILQYVKCPKEIEVKTYALKPRLVEFPRDIEFYCKGQLIAIMRTIWMVFDINTNSLANLANLADFASDYPGVFKDRVRKLPVVNKELLNFKKNQQVEYSMLDHNKHMNNTKYLDLYFDVYGFDNREIKYIQCEYIKQCYHGEIIHIYGLEDENSNQLYGFKEKDGHEELVFYMKVNY